MTNIELYLNIGKNTCITIPRKVSLYLQVDKFLSEYDTDEEKELARHNLGIDELVELLISNIENNSDLLEEIRTDILNRITLINSNISSINETLEQELRTVTSELDTKVNSTDYNNFVDLTNNNIQNLINEVNEHIQEYNNFVSTTQNEISSINSNIDRIEGEIENILNLLNPTKGQFYIGSGDTYDDILSLDPIEFVKEQIKGYYDIEIEDGKKIFAVFPNSEQKVKFYMNGIEIPFTKQTTEGYDIYESSNVYIEGNYTININS